MMGNRPLFFSLLLCLLCTISTVHSQRCDLTKCSVHPDSPFNSLCTTNAECVQRATDQYCWEESQWICHRGACGYFCGAVNQCACFEWLDVWDNWPDTSTDGDTNAVAPIEARKPKNCGRSSRADRQRELKESKESEC